MKQIKDKRMREKSQGEKDQYDYYIGMDWSLSTTSIAYMRSEQREPKVVTLRSKVVEITEFLSGLPGRKILTFEETTGAQWLYVELHDAVDRILVCDPYRNALLGEGPKTDSIDSRKLCLLLRSGLLKEVYHSLESAYWLRTLVWSYLKFTRQEVQLLNQQSALYRAFGKRHKGESFPQDNSTLLFVLRQLEKRVSLYVQQKERYLEQFHRIAAEHRVIRYLKGMTGLGTVTSVILYGVVLDARRFPDKYHFWSYCGLVRHPKLSGGRHYGYRQGRYVGVLKWVFRTATMAALRGHNDIRAYYEYLLSKNYSPRRAQHAVSRYIATASYAVMKHQEPYRPYQWRESNV